MTKSLNAAYSASWRERKRLKDQELIDAYNAECADKDHPPVSLVASRPGNVMKGKSRPSYNPPPEVMAKMTRNELSGWRHAERLKRKAAKQCENRAKKKQLLENIKKQLPDFESKVVTVRNPKYTYNPPPEVMAKMSKQQLSDWRANERKKRNTEKQREIRKRKKQEREAAKLDLVDKVEGLKSLQVVANTAKPDARKGEEKSAHYLPNEVESTATKEAMNVQKMASEKNQKVQGKKEDGSNQKESHGCHEEIKMNQINPAQVLMMLRNDCECVTFEI